MLVRYFQIVWTVKYKYLQSIYRCTYYTYIKLKIILSKIVYTKLHINIMNKNNDKYKLKH